jgi:hypothetical protein
MTGIDLIALERARQINEEGFSLEDDRRCTSGELIDAGISYATAAAKQSRGEDSLSYLISLEGAGCVPWPWESAWWKPSKDKVRNLVKAGALIAAELDRITAEESGMSEPNLDNLFASDLCHDFSHSTIESERRELSVLRAAYIASQDDIDNLKQRIQELEKQKG